MSPSAIGPYRIVRKLGEGGMGAVYEGFHEAIERRVAIKVLHTELARDREVTQRFINEARAVNIVNHPGIVQVSDFGEQPDGSAFIVMEFLDGETLAQRLRRLGGRLPAADSLRLVRQVAAALAAAHQKGIVHRDLKPENLMLVPDPDPEQPGRERVKVLDFGIAKLANDQKGKKPRTHADMIFGTPEYMAPEQARGAAHVDDKADVYSLGIILYQLLSGRTPFLAEESGSVMAMHIYEMPTPLRQLAPEVSDELAGFVHRMLRKDRSERPTMAQVVGDLERLVPRERPGAGSEPGVSASSSATSLSASSNPGAARAAAVAATSDEHRTPEASVSEPSEGPRSGVAAPRSTVDPLAQTLLPQGVGSERRRLPPVALRVAAGLLALTVPLVITWKLRHPSASSRRPSEQQPASQVPMLIAPAVRPAEPPPPVPAPVAPAAPLMVHWSVASTPTGAEVVELESGKVLGKTPWEKTQTAGVGAVTLRLQLAGHAPRELSLDRSADAQRTEELQPIPQRPLPKRRKGQHKKSGGAPSDELGIEFAD